MLKLGLGRSDLQYSHQRGSTKIYVRQEFIKHQAKSSRGCFFTSRSRTCCSMSLTPVVKRNWPPLDLSLQRACRPADHPLGDAVGSLTEHETGYKARLKPNVVNPRP